ncbi:MAG TPA: flavin reductase family protein [Usitatibacter sp.]|nr:flavin reductase family protein [Usitatibacter sp.]
MPFEIAARRAKVAGKRAYPRGKVYGLIEPGPVVLVTTVRDGKPDVMAMSWLTMLEFEPPLVGCVMSNRNYSFDSLVAARECGINIPTVELAPKVVKCGNASGRSVDKFARFALTPVPATRIAPPLVAECYANLECRVVDDRMVEPYGFFVLEVVAAWIDPARKEPRQIHHRGNGVFAVDGRRLLKLASRMK